MMGKVMRALYIGRFQPYHLGHQAVIEKIAEEVEEIVIVIGSAQDSHTTENPFTGGERMEMIYASLRECSLSERCVVTPLQDVQWNSIWVSHLQSMVPRFDLVYSNNPLVVQLISEAGIAVRKPPMYQRDLYSGTAIRRLMREGETGRGWCRRRWRRSSGKMGGVERLISVSKSDMP